MLKVKATLSGRFLWEVWQWSLPSLVPIACGILLALSAGMVGVRFCSRVTFLLCNVWSKIYTVDSCCLYLCLCLNLVEDWQRIDLSFSHLFNHQIMTLLWFQPLWRAPGWSYLLCSPGIKIDQTFEYLNKKPLLSLLQYFESGPFVLWEALCWADQAEGRILLTSLETQSWHVSCKNYNSFDF